MLPESLQRLLDGQTQDSTKHHEASSSSIKGDHEVSTVSLGERERLPDLEKIVQADSSSSPNSSHLPPLSSGLELRTLVDVDQSGKQHLCLSLQNDG